MKSQGRIAALLVIVAVAVCGPGQAVAQTVSGIGTNVAVDGDPVPEYHDVLDTWVRKDLLDGAVVVVTPGTDDTGLYPRINGIVGDRESKIVQYPESFWPLMAGKAGTASFLAPTYDASRDIAIAHNLTVMKAVAGENRMMVYTGFSQGAEVLGNAAEQAHDAGLLGPNTMILLVSDPRGPWGIKSAMGAVPFSSLVMDRLGAKNNGARDPARTGDTDVVQVIVKGDPVADWQWDPRRPVESLLVDGAGFVGIHANTGAHSYAHLENLDHVATYRSAEGHTTYEIYDTYHPLVQVPAMIAEAVGSPLPDGVLEQWNQSAEDFYPIQDVTPENADPVADVAPEPPRRRHRPRSHDGPGRRSAVADVRVNPRELGDEQYD